MITVGPSLGGCHDTRTVVGLTISAERLVGGAAPKYKLQVNNITISEIEDMEINMLSEMYVLMHDCIWQSVDLSTPHCQ